MSGTANDTHVRHRLTRRRLLKLGLGVGAVSIVLGSGAAFLAWPRAVAPGRRALASGEVAFVEALVGAYLPPGNGLLEARDHVESVVQGVDAYVAMLPQTEHRLLRALLTAGDQLPRLTFASGTRFTALPLDEQVAFLEGLERGGSQMRELALFFRLLIGIALFDGRAAWDRMGLDWGCPVIP